MSLQEQTLPKKSVLCVTNNKAMTSYKMSLLVEIGWIHEFSLHPICFDIFINKKYF
jgi:hypothetical protein